MPFTEIFQPCRTCSVSLPLSYVSDGITRHINKDLKWLGSIPGSLFSSAARCLPDILRFSWPLVISADDGCGILWHTIHIRMANWVSGQQGLAAENSLTNVLLCSWRTRVSTPSQGLCLLFLIFLASYIFRSCKAHFECLERADGIAWAKMVELGTWKEVRAVTAWAIVLLALNRVSKTNHAGNIRKIGPCSCSHQMLSRVLSVNEVKESQEKAPNNL